MNATLEGGIHLWVFSSSMEKLRGIENLKNLMAEVPKGCIMQTGNLSNENSLYPR
jgi:hypothetical protein